MTEFTEKLYKGIVAQALHEKDKYEKNNIPMKSIEDSRKRRLEYWVAKVAYEWALNGIVR